MVNKFNMMSYKSKHNEPKHIVSEPMGVYVTGNSVNPFYGVLGGQKGYSSDWDIIRLAREGFPKRALLALAKKISLNLQEITSILHISERTLQRYDDDVIIKSEYAEKAVELARLYTRGQEVFGSIDKFKLWMKAPSLIFNGEAPVSVLDTSAGFDMVFTELGRIEHGIFV
jgi:putative toxin-antitoxin system antitoxin component (TIGR02293 family)